MPVVKPSRNGTHDLYDGEGCSDHLPIGHKMLEAALKLHARGLWVVPCDGKKANRVKDWGKVRLTEEELTNHIQTSKQNIAIVLSQSDYIDVEADSTEADELICEMLGGECRTPTWESARGKHRLFKRPKCQLPVVGSLEVDGIEFRGIQKGDVHGITSTVPPSIGDNGKARKWLKGLSIFEVEPIELPKPLLELLLKTKPNPKKGSEAEGKKGKRKETHSETLLRLVEKVEFWQGDDEKGYASIEREGHKEHYLIRSKMFRMWLANEFRKETQSTPSTTALEEVLVSLEGQAVFDTDGDKTSIFVRVGEAAGRIYLDIGTPDWSAIEIDASGWRACPEPPIKFRRRSGLEALPIPTTGGQFGKLWEFVNVAEGERVLIAAWLLGALRPVNPSAPFPYPHLKLLGQQGSGKTLLAKMLRKIIDPNRASARTQPRNEEELALSANNSWIVSLDNLSYLRPEMADALCRLSTGGGLAKRQLYTDDDEVIYQIQRPVILNGIEEVTTRSDMMERTLGISLPPINEDQRRTETRLWRDFETALPGILGALLDAVVVALRELPKVEAREDQKWPRMADFAQWVVAGIESLGFTEQEFRDKYSENQVDSSMTSLTSSVIMPALIAFVKSKPDHTWSGTATALLDELKTTAPANTKAHGWPSNAQKLSGQLDRLAPALIKNGCVAEKKTTKNQKTWTIRIPQQLLDSFNYDTQLTQDFTSSSFNSVEGELRKT